MKDHFGGQVPAPVLVPLKVTWRRLALVVVLLLMILIAAHLATGWVILVSSFAGSVFGSHVSWTLGVRAAEIHRAEQAGEKRRAADLRSVKW